MAHARKDYFAVLTQPVPVRTKARVAKQWLWMVPWCLELWGRNHNPISAWCGIATSRRKGDIVKLKGQQLHSTKVRWWTGTSERGGSSPKPGSCRLLASPAFMSFRMLVHSSRCAGRAAGWRGWSRGRRFHADLSLDRPNNHGALWVLKLNAPGVLWMVPAAGNRNQRRCLQWLPTCGASISGSVLRSDGTSLRLGHVLPGKCPLRWLPRCKHQGPSIALSLDRRAAHYLHETVKPGSVVWLAKDQADHQFRCGRWCGSRWKR